MNKKICLKEFIPEKAVCIRNISSYELGILEEENHLCLRYLVDVYNRFGKCAQRCFALFLPKTISRTNETFEVLGLLQGEMNKKQDGKITFCNHEYQLVNKVINWFETEFNFPKEEWKWYIKVNINEPVDSDYRKNVENKVISYWLEKSGLSLQMTYPKRVSYIKNTKHKQLKELDHGSLIIERRFNIFSQIIKKLVRDITYNILDYTNDEVRSFMKGIIAGESNVELDAYLGHYRVFVSAIKFEEREIFHNCLKRLNIKSTNYPNFHAVIISRKENNLKLMDQGLMELSPEKYAKFVKMMNCYQSWDICGEFNYDLPKDLIMAC